MANKQLIEDLEAKRDAAEDMMIEANEQMSVLDPETDEYAAAQARYLRWSGTHDILTAQIDSEYEKS